MKTKMKQMVEVRQIGPKSWGVFEDSKEKSRFRSKAEARQWMIKYRKR